MAKSKPKNWVVGRWLIESMTSGTGISLTRRSVATSSSTARILVRSSSAMWRAKSTTGLAKGTASPPSSSPGTATTKWTRPRDVAGWSLKAMN